MEELEPIIKVWKEKLVFLKGLEATTVDPEQKYKLTKLIGEAESKLAEYGAERAARSGPAVTTAVAETYPVPPPRIGWHRRYVFIAVCVIAMILIAAIVPDGRDSTRQHDPNIELQIQGSPAGCELCWTSSRPSCGPSEMGLDVGGNQSAGQCIILNVDDRGNLFKMSVYGECGDTAIYSGTIPDGPCKEQKIALSKVR